MVLICLMQLSVFAQKAYKPKITPAQKKYILHPNTALQFNYYDSINFDFTLVKGKTSVIEYFYKAAENSAIADDEFTERLLVEIPNGKNNFKITAGGTNAKKMVYHRSCFCRDGGNYSVIEGAVKGKFISKNVCDATINIIADQTPNRGIQPKNFSFKGQFKYAK